LKYALPAEHGEFTRGIPTSHAAEPFRSVIAQNGDPSPAWPFSEGKERGISFEPLHKSAASAAVRNPLHRRLRRAMRDPNLSQLMAPAGDLRPLPGELVFVGGCVTGILITDEAAAEPRGTLYVDAIAEITSYVQYAEFGERLRALGFREDTSEGAPLCRWIRDQTIGTGL